MDHHGKSFDKVEPVGCDFLVKQLASRSRASKSITNPPPSFIRIFGKCPLFTHDYNCITFPRYHFFQSLFQSKVFIALLFSESFTPNMSFSPFVYGSHFGQSIQPIHSFSKPTSHFFFLKILQIQFQKFIVTITINYLLYSLYLSIFITHFDSILFLRNRL